MGDGSGGFIARQWSSGSRGGSVPAQNRKNNWIWNRSLVFPCTSYIYLVFAFPLKKLTVKKQITCGIYRGCVRSVPSSRSFMVRRSISLHVGNVWLDGDQGIYFLLMIFGTICISFFRICGLFHRHFLNYMGISENNPGF